ncbi:MAG: DJ-1/PfpI family protein [Ignavibacteriaceae bacterium]|jgi:putative intracellular protease/amidase|nr:DJ-1/PfpI family protein [Ignavibacteriaceae bacterium]
MNNNKVRDILLFLPANDFNEHEFLVIKNGLRDAELKYFILSDTSALCVGSNGLKVKPDMMLYNANARNFAGMILCGGNGAKRYWSNQTLHRLIKDFRSSPTKILGAICNSAVTAARAGVITEKAVCYPEFKGEIEKEGVKFIDQPVVFDKNIITAREQSSSCEFISSYIAHISKFLE